MERNVATLARRGVAYITLAHLFYRGVALYRAWRSTRKIALSAVPVELSEDVYQIVERCRTILSLDRVRILRSPSIPVPITLGFVNPLVILPERLLLETDPDLLTSAIGHELVHVLPHLEVALHDPVDQPANLRLELLGRVTHHLPLEGPLDALGVEQ